MSRAFDPTLYFIADPESCAGRPVATVVAAAIEVGATLIQYRDKMNAEMTRRETACDLLTLCQHKGVPLLINDDVTLAAEINADGAHIGQGDLNPHQAREILGEDKILGLTAFTPEHFAEIDPNIIDYTGTGPVHPTQTDKGKPVMGYDGLEKLVKISPVPVVGIGGITPQNTENVIKTGASGIAVMRYIGEAERPDLAAHEFITHIKESKNAA